MHYFKTKKQRKEYEDRMFKEKGYKYGKSKIINGECYLEIIMGKKLTLLN